jgi:hypothetical protein
VRERDRKRKRERERERERERTKKRERERKKLTANYSNLKKDLSRRTKPTIGHQDCFQMSSSCAPARGPMSFTGWTDRPHWNTIDLCRISLIFNLV